MRQSLRTAIWRLALAATLLLVVLVAFPALAAASPPEVWVEAEGIAAMGQDMTLETAQRHSLDAARRAAIEQVVGTFVSSSTVVHNYQLADDLVRAVVRGVIVEEKILRRGVLASKDDQGALYQTRIKAKVKGLPVERRGSFAVTATLSRTQFTDGDEAELRITSTQDAYLYLFAVTPDEHITVLAPNKYVSELRATHGEDVVFPTEGLLRQRVKLRTWLQPGAKHSTEKIKVIATRQAVALLKGQVSEAVFKEYNPADTALLIDLMRALAALDPADWAETTVAYEVRK